MILARPLLHENKLISWASAGLLIFVSSFLWAPSRDGIQIIYLLAFFLPVLMLLIFIKFDFIEFGGWPTAIALSYAGFCTVSAFWGTDKDIGFFILQWFVLLTWLVGSCIVFSRHNINVEKYLDWFIACGTIVIIITIVHYYYFVFGASSTDKRLWGWNVFRNANEVGAMCGIIALLSFVVAIKSKFTKRALLFYTFCSIAFIGLILSFSRGAFFAFVIMSAIALLIERPSIKIWVSIALGVAVLLAIVLTKTDVVAYYTAGRDEGMSSRLDIWQEIFHRCRQHLLVGIGMSKETGIIVPNVGMYNHAHNAWLDTFYRTGVIGLVLIVAHINSILQKNIYSPRLTPLYMWLGYGYICHLFDGRCFFWEINAKWFLYWIPAGLIVAIHTGTLVRVRNGKA